MGAQRGTQATSRGMGWTPGPFGAMRWGRGETWTEPRGALGREVAAKVSAVRLVPQVPTWAEGEGKGPERTIDWKEAKAGVPRAMRGCPLLLPVPLPLSAIYLNPSPCALPLPNISAPLGPFVILS